ncbi:HalOD1 output domain-containing protein [Halosimplex aquaticum]|uniref:HalOD1 output domain-containing protein n=1 Tax=Halosimplex aquaticum TaxID=3026162 RepID=A0ABD5Y843_9EURY|nr:HalOD1 output domain-containing protein [Halosimplex aquaticum]
MINQRAWADSPHAYEADLESVAPESASVAVYRAVAALTDTEPESLDPLGRTVDTDALDALLDGSGDSDCRVSFRYQGFLVEVAAGDSVRLTPLSEGAIGEADP